MAETDDEIDKLKLPAAVRLAKKRSISISGLKDLEEIKCELKKHLLVGRRKRDNVIQDLMIAAEEDSRVRHELIKIYQKTLESLGNQSHNDPLIRSVNKCYKKTDVIDMLKKLKGKLDGNISRCPVLVLGDTGAGKSSFINLLLGQQVFPCSLLSNTSVICEISYCDIPSARLYPHDDEDDSVTMEIIQAEEMADFDFEKLSRLVQQRDEIKRRSRFQKAEISFPLPILKTGLIIVDSPGVGDTPEMTKLVLDYLMEASAFVFIINTIDGVQISRLEMLLEQLVKRVMTGDKYYKPDCTMFICNKWDQVPIDERNSVYQDAVKKLKKIWIGFQSPQLYTLSTKEALWIQKDGLIVGRFEKILQGIISLLPPSRQQLLAMSTGLYPHDDEDDSVTMEIIQAEEMADFDFEKLSRLVQQRDEIKRRSRFQKAEISFPLPILKTGLIIVDSPGVGDTPEMTKLVLDYLMEASAFVFIINTIDGVQISRLEMLLEQLVKRVMTGDKYYKPDCTMFICNKWDQVPIDERNSVYQDAVKKLKKIWIGFQSPQLYTLSTKEALWIQKDGLIVGRFEKILQGIISLLPPSRQQLLAMSTGKLYEFLNNCMTCIGNNLQQIEMKPEEARRQTLMISTNMNVLKSEVNEFFEQQKSGLKSNLSRLADDLSKHLRTEKVKKDLSNFDSNDPEIAGKNFQDVAIVIRSRVYDGISKHMRLWEDQEKHLEGIGKQLMDRFKQKFPDFDAQLFQVEKLFRNTLSGDQNDSEEKMPLVPDVISNRFSSLNLGIKVILGVALSPVFLIGVIVRLPYWGLRQLGTMFKNEMLTRNFEKGDESDKNKVIIEYRDNVISRMTEKSVIDSCLGSQLSVLYQYIDNQNRKVIEQIDGKLEMLNTSVQDNSPQQNIAWVNSQMTVDILLKNLEYFTMMFLPQNLHYRSADDFDITETLTNGIMTKIVLAKDKKNGDTVAIRQNDMAVVMDRIKHYQKEERYYREGRKPHIITVNLFLKKDMEIWQCFSPPRQTLRQYITQKNYKEYDDTKLEFYYKVLNQVAQGLAYLQRHSLVHIDLSQDTIMVDTLDKVTLVNMSCPNLLDETKFSADITDVAGYVHFSVDIISNPNMTMYEMKHDMYSLGILMWELWSQQPAFKHQITENNITDLKMFCEFLKTIDMKSLLPSLQDNDNITSLRNTWHSIIVQSLQVVNDLTARKWLDNFVHDSRPQSEVTQLYRRGDHDWDEPVSSRLYSRIH